MIFFIIGVVFISLFALSGYVLRDKMSSIFLNVYLIWWLCLLGISLSNPFGLYEVSLWTYCLILLSISFFSFGFIFNRLITKIEIKKEDTNIEAVLLESYDKTKGSKLFVSLLVLFSIIIFNYLMQYQKAILLFGTEEARVMRYFVGNVFKYQIEIYFYNYVIESFSIFVSAYLAFSFVWLRFNKVFFLSLIYVYLYSSFGSGRFYIIELGFFICFLFLLKNKVFSNKNKTLSLKEKKKIKTRKRVTLLVIIPTLFCFYLFSIYLSNFRKGLFELNYENFITGNSDFFEQIIVYCVGSFRALEYGLNSLSKEFPITFGSMNFGGLDEFLGFLLRIFGINYQYSNVLYGELTSKTITIGFDQEYNALYTNVFGQYLDFGILGIVFLSFFWGFIFNLFVVAFQKLKTFYLLLMVSFLFVTSILTPLLWKFQSPSAWIFMLFLVYLDNKKNINSKMIKVLAFKN
ncbi:O-antigen polymerase [Flavobacterium tructae]|uniref:Oligosaccharide repeat unit polymerase n=1 Tax=Flavobacterium tructae TaxID=1114873 RepID=A0A1S1J4W8_9FLAO|nr:O-antigen polymerase [Flavobacterium tructae]OHT44641.1 hypothetical protein BHE19_13100 [Flavobacterium tructae]OXB19221.1 hypothetical protein B0A71_11770 [Flavobacterium tructae]